MFIKVILEDAFFFTLCGNVIDGKGNTTHANLNRQK